MTCSHASKKNVMPLKRQRTEKKNTFRKVNERNVQNEDGRKIVLISQGREYVIVNEFFVDPYFHFF
jgi:TPP-dependent indolepyruvate ferredoxin oxidoreductase alpha subunit